MQGTYMGGLMYFVIAIPTSTFAMIVFIRNYKASKEGTTLIKAKPKIKVFGAQAWIVTTLITIIASVGLIAIAYKIGDKHPILSPLTLVLTGMGFILSVRMYIEQFVYFLVGNVVNIVMFVMLAASDINNVSSVVLFSIFTVVSSIGLYNWLKMYRNQKDSVEQEEYAKSQEEHTITTTTITSNPSKVVA
jgi:nicotinamide mononucleotide transporter PnuC